MKDREFVITLEVTLRAGDKAWAEKRAQELRRALAYVEDVEECSVRGVEERE